MSQKGSRIIQPDTSYQQSYVHTYVPIDHNYNNYTKTNPNTFSTYSIQNNTKQTYNNRSLTSNEVSQITGEKIRDGSVVKGRSRIEYVPFEKKVVDYETRTYKEMVPRTRKVIDYEERKIVQSVPRQVIKQDYIAVEKITQYVKEIIPEKKVEVIPVQRKVKRVEYVPVEKQIVHYPKGQEFINVQGKSRVVLESQGVQVRPDAQYRPIQSDLLYKFTNSTQNPHVPVGYVDLGSRRYLSTAPTYSTNNLGYSNVQPFSNGQNYGSREAFQFQQSQIYDGAKSFINNLNGSELRSNLQPSGTRNQQYQYQDTNTGYTARSVNYN